MKNVLIVTYSIHEIEDICELVHNFDDGMKQIAFFTKGTDKMSKFQNAVTHIVSLGQFTELVKNVEEVYLSPTLAKLNKEIFKKIVELIIMENKKIILSREIENYCKNECEMDVPSKLKYKFKADKEPEIVKEQLLEIRVPVLYITSFWEGLNKFQILLKTKTEFEKKGYKVLAFGSKRESEFVGIEALPEYLFQSSYDEKIKIIGINQLVEKRCDEEKPDIVIISVPGEISKFSDETLGHMGIMLWELKNAVFPDCMICSVPFEKYTEADAKNMKAFITQVCGISCTCLHMANKMINKVCSHRKRTLYYLNISREEVDKIVDKNLENISNYHHRKFDICIDSIINKLLNNGKIEII